MSVKEMEKGIIRYLKLILEILQYSAPIKTLIILIIVLIIMVLEKDLHCTRLELLPNLLINLINKVQCKVLSNHKLKNHQYAPNAIKF